MTGPATWIGPRDALHPSRVILYVLLGWAFGVYHRPYLPEFLPSYAAFTGVMPWAWWGWAAVIGAALIQLTPPGTGWRLITHAWNGTFFLLVAGTFTSSVGITTAATTYTILGYVCVILWARSAVAFAAQRSWWAALVNRPPRVIQWLADWGRDGRD